MSPQLPQKVAKVVESVEAAGSYGLIPTGLYGARLRSVEVKQSETFEGEKGDPYWVWEYEIIDEGDYENRRLWNNTSLSEKSLPFLKKTFLAFGVEDFTTSTDALCGQWVTLNVGTRTINKGAREGEVVNNVIEVLPYEGDGEDPDAE